MNTRISLIVAAALALWSIAGSASIKNVEDAYESDAAHVTLPANASGQVAIRECAACKPVVLKVNNQTRYILGAASSPPVSLEALREAAAADGAESRLLTIFYSLDSGFVTRIVLAAG